VNRAVLKSLVSFVVFSIALAACVGCGSRNVSPPTKSDLQEYLQAHPDIAKAAEPEVDL
jgi:hypothetical protein